MAYEELCMYCFEDRGGKTICPHCGRDSRAAVPQVLLLPGTLVYHDRFLIGRARGQDSTGIVYAAYDTRRDNRINIREYMPRDCAERLNDGTVAPISGMEDRFERGMRKLQASVENVEDPRKRHFYFEENGTAYVAQRHGAASTASKAAEDEEPEDSTGLKHLGLIVGIAAAVVALAAIVFIVLLNNIGDTSTEQLTAQTVAPTQSALNVWAPVETQTPTPTTYVAPTFKALVDPDQSWMDYTYSGDVNQEYDERTGTFATATPTTVPTLRPEATRFDNTVSGNSDAATVRQLQLRLVELGWLSASDVNGAYDSTTRQAVRDFQNYVNTVLRPSEKLSVDGLAGPKTQQWLYGTDSYKPTPTPTVVVTANPRQDGTVDRSSDKSEIRDVQRKLIALGLLDSGSDDGVYGNSTNTAVKKFQARVNQLHGYAVLEITGTVDAQTMAFLNYYVAQWEQLRRATATPARATATPVPMFTATAAPKATNPPKATTPPTQRPTAVPTTVPATQVPATATPEPAPDESDAPESQTTVNRDSPKESIQFVQQMLIKVGLLPEGSDDGVFGNATAAALYRFQEYVNDQAGVGTVAVTGQADPTTLGYLEKAAADGMNANATAAPTEGPTQVPGVPTDAPEDNIAVDENSLAETIAFVQQELIRVGLLPQGSADGRFGSGTRNAVIAFQQYVNATQGAGTVNENGELDAVTLGYLETAAADGVNVGGNGATAQPAQQAMAPNISLSNTTQDESGVYVANGDRINFNWSTGSRAVYDIHITDSNGKEIWSAEGTERTEGRFSRSELKEGEVYTLRIGARPVGADEADTTWSEVRFAFMPEAVAEQTQIPEVVVDATEQPEPTATAVPEVQPVTLEVSVNGANATDTLYDIEGNSVTFNWVSSGPAAYFLKIQHLSGNREVIEWSEDNTNRTELTVNRKDFPDEGIYTLQIGAMPAGGGAQDMTFRFIDFEFDPAAVQASPVSVNVTGAASEGGIYTAAGDEIHFDWSAENAQSYYVTVTTSSGATLLESPETQNTSGTFTRDQLTAGEIYRLRIGAVPYGGTADDIVWTDTEFAFSSNEPQLQDGEQAEAEAEQEGIRSIDLEINGTTPGGVVEFSGGSVSFNWTASGDVAGYTVAVTDSQGNRVINMDSTQSESGSIGADRLTAGEVYTIRVGAIPANGGDTVWTEGRFTLAGGEQAGGDEGDYTPVSQPAISVDGTARTENGMRYLTGSSAIFSWKADGSVKEYRVYVVSDSGARSNTDTTTGTSRTIDLSGFAPGEYKLYVGAVPAYATSDDDIAWSSFAFAIPGLEEIPAPDGEEDDGWADDWNGAGADT